jgi:hypothetical protein
MIDAIVFVIVRVVYFIGGSGLTFFILVSDGRRHRRTSLAEWLDLSSTQVLLICLTAGALIACLGPLVHEEDTNRGRGALAAIRRASSRKPPKDGNRS